MSYVLSSDSAGCDGQALSSASQLIPLCLAQPPKSHKMPIAMGQAIKKKRQRLEEEQVTGIVFSLKLT